ncbi:MAG: hypothetical protein GY759_01650, partial [Chloroflexi bacterium]|nr:hypothetical protein [Chloroflexota bacterium]
MDVDAINRAGIFMAFLAGFLLAPELIGEERLHNMGKRLDLLAIRIRRDIRDRIGLGSWERKQAVQFVGNLLIFLLVPIFYFVAYHLLIMYKPSWAFLGPSILAHFIFAGMITIW